MIFKKIKTLIWRDVLLLVEAVHISELNSKKQVHWVYSNQLLQIMDTIKLCCY